MTTFLFEYDADGTPVEWPRLYTSAELEALAKSLGCKELGRVTVYKLQKAVEAFQWACFFDDGYFPSNTKLSRRQRLMNIISLCQQEAPAEEIEVVLNELDGHTSQLLGPVNSTDLQAVHNAAEVALKKIPSSGPDRKRAARQFIEELARIYHRVTGEFPGRRVHIRDYAPEHVTDNDLPDQEYGPFRDLVKAALMPFEPEDKKAPRRKRRRYNADIRAALSRLKAG